MMNLFAAFIFCFFYFFFGEVKVFSVANNGSASL